MRNNNGITLVSLIITIVLMLILASVTISFGLSTYNNMKINRFVAQMQMIQKSVDNFSEEYRTEDEIKEKLRELLGRNISYITEADKMQKISTSRANDEITWTNDNSFIYFSVQDIEKAFGLDNIREKDEFAINFNTREVISLIGEEYQGKRYYTGYNKALANSQRLIEHTPLIRTLEFNIDEIRNFGLNSRIIVKDISVANTILSYREVDGTWITVENRTRLGREYEINITKSGVYEVRIENANGDQFTSESELIMVHNSPRVNEELVPINSSGNVISEVDIRNGLWYNYAGSGEKWAFARNNSSSKVYVWIPRLIYNTNNTDIKFLKGNTNIPTDGEDVKITDNSIWKLPSQFIRRFYIIKWHMGRSIIRR
jgi:type II secretory pathway pseudopilin PulG